MPGISRNGHLAATGHACDTVAPVRATSRSVYVNGIRIARRGDPLAPHLIKIGKKCKGHSAKVNRGSPSVFAEGIPVARRNDSADRGRMIQASFNVFANGG